MSNSWVKFLEIRGICYPDSVGNMPCDNGCPCDKCHAEYIQKDYASWLIAQESIKDVRYTCRWCDKHGTSREWTRATLRNARHFQEPYPDGWDMETAENDDNVCCPNCNCDDYRSEVLRYIEEE